MDRTGIIVVAVCAVLLVLWFVEQEQFAKQQARYEQTHPPAKPVNGPAATNAGPAATSAMSSAPTSSPLPPSITNQPEQTIVLTNDSVRYTFTSRGGGLKLVELLKYPQTISMRWKTKNGAQTNGVASLNTLAYVPSLAVLGDSSLVGDGIFSLTRDGDGVRAEKTLPDGLRLVKEFHPSSNYLVNATVWLQNTTDKPLSLPAQQFVVGTATPMDPDDNNFFGYGGAMWYDGSSVRVCNPTYFNTNTAVFFVFSRTPHGEYVAGATNVMWAAVYNQFFALAAMPKEPADEVLAQPVSLPPFPNIEVAPGAPPPQGVQAALVYPAQTLTANSSVERQIVLFAGPKEYRTLARVGVELGNRADLVMNWGSGFYSFWGIGTFFAKLLLSAMNALHDMTNVGYGWAIVIITVILRAVFWPLMAGATRSMKRMQALAPEVTALKEKYKDDQQKLMQKQMELWKKHNVSPMSGCWPMMLQMPVFMGFFTMIRSAIELRGAHFLWVTDLSKPDTLFMIPGLNFPFNFLPLLMGGMMLWQSHLTPPSPGMDPSQQKLLRYMPLIFLVFLYNYSGGLALYMTISTGLSVLQTKVTKNLKDPAVTKVNPVLSPVSKSKK
jgi:YidC/Oxa1 family membrane protein insertase